MTNPVFLSGKKNRSNFLNPLPYYSFNTYLKEHFHERVHRISLNAGFSCPNFDGEQNREGCIYCNNKAFSLYSKNELPLEEQIRQSIAFYKHQKKVHTFIAYFQSYTNTYSDIETLKKSYEVIRNFPEIRGLSISTRPDCVDEEKIRMISDYSKDYMVWMEYGVQTTHNRLLKRVNRNHSFEDFLNALDLTRKYGISAGVHMILGLPEARYEDMMKDAETLAKLDIQGIKFHVLHVLKGSPLEKEYAEGSLNLLSQEQYIQYLCDYLERIPAHWVVFRLVSTADREYLVAPHWINNRNQIIETVNQELMKRGTRQGSKTIF